MSEHGESARQDDRADETPAGPPPGFFRALPVELARILLIKPTAPLTLWRRIGSWWLSLLFRESAPQLAAAGIAGLVGLRLLGFQGRLARLARWLTVIGVVGELRNAWIAHRSTKRIDEAMEGIEPAQDDAPRVPLSQLAFPPLMFVAPGVRRERGRPFATVDGLRLRLDIYRPERAHDGPRPAVIQIHGGAWFAGSRYEQGVPLLNHLANLGWVGFNADYRLAPQATFPAQIHDVKRAIAWVRANADELGIDPGMICLTGGSAGGHLTALAALTAGDTSLQPGFEDADTSVAAAVPFYGVYDLTNANGFYYPGLRDWVFEEVVFQVPYAGNEDAYRQASPTHRIHADAPPFLVIHGDSDTLVPVEDARDFTAKLAAVSDNPVRYVELPGAEHAFDLWPSERTVRISEAIGRFLTGVAKAERRAPAEVS